MCLALHQAAIGKKPAETDVLIRRFLEILFRRRRLPGAKTLLNSFQMVCDEIEKRMPVKITAARRLAPAELKIILDSLKRKFQVKEIVAEKVIDPALVGGWKIEARDLVIDGSLAGQLKKLHANLTQ